MSNFEKVIIWGGLGVFGYLKWKQMRAGTERLGNGRRNAGSFSSQPHPLGTGSLGHAEAYTDAFPDDGLGGDHDTNR